jgi:hypothetical protein
LNESGVVDGFLVLGIDAEHAEITRQLAQVVVEEESRVGWWGAERIARVHYEVVAVADGVLPGARGAVDDNGAALDMGDAERLHDVAESRGQLDGQSKQPIYGSFVEEVGELTFDLDGELDHGWRYRVRTTRSRQIAKP